MPKRLVNEDSQCAYCSRPATTRDHVVPSNLFTTPRPSDMITVPCCEECNKKKGTTDTFLRDVLCNFDGGPNKVADDIRTGSFKRAVDRNQSEVWKEIKSRASESLHFHRGSEFLGSLLMMPYGKGPLKDSIVFMTKGISFWLSKTRIPDDHVFLVGGFPDFNSLAVQYQNLKQLGSVGSAKIGDNSVFSCFTQSYIVDDGTDDIYASVWGYLFFKRTYIGCITMAPNLSEKLPREWLEMF